MKYARCLSADRRPLASTAITAAGLFLALSSVGIAQQRPDWAFAAPLPRTHVAETAKDQVVPGSREKFSEAELWHNAVAIDWFPSAHPPMPTPVGGKQDGADACAYCHLPNGSGRPENASLAGMSYAYLVQQVSDIKSGARLPIPGYFGSLRMVEVVHPLDEASVAIAARYFSSLRYVKRLHVVEAESVPHYILNGVYLFDGLGARVPLGERILEGPDDATRFARRDERISYTAYVPVGSIARGRTMVQRAGAGQVPCASCHGTGLKGGIAPPLAGRSPTVTFRQLYAFQNDLRNGEDAATMKAMVAGLPLQRLIDLSAYCASLAP